MAISKRLRYEILRRDQHTCHYCGAQAPDVKLTVDHVVPTALGGSDDPANLVAACAGCNAGKSASTPGASLVAAVDEKAAQFALAVNQVIEERLAKQEDDRKILGWFDEVWRGWTQPAVERDADWEASILRFHAAGVSPEYMRRAVDTAMGNRTVRAHKVWRYFCGICWNEVRSIQDDAAKLVSDAGLPGSAPGRDLSENLEAVRTLTEVGLRQLLMAFQFSEDAVSDCWEVFAFAQQYMGTRFIEVDPNVPVHDALDDIVMTAMEDPAYRQPYLDLLGRIIGDGSLESD